VANRSPAFSPTARIRWLPPRDESGSLFAIDIGKPRSVSWKVDAQVWNSYRHFIDFIALHPALNSGDREKILYGNAIGLFFGRR